MRNLASSIDINSIVVLGYTLGTRHEFVDYVERKGELYAVVIGDVLKATSYSIHHLTASELTELWEYLPRLVQAMTNFSIENGIISYDGYVRHIELDDNSLSLFKGETITFTERTDTLWGFIRHLIEHSVDLYVEDAKNKVSPISLRYSDGTPNIVVPVRDSEGMFTSKTVYSLDSSITCESLLIKDEIPDEFKAYTVPHNSFRKLDTTHLPITGLSIEDFRQVYSAPLLIYVLNLREYYKVIKDAGDLIKAYDNILHPQEAPPSMQSEHTATLYTTNCVLNYSVSKPRLSGLKKKFDTESPEEFQTRVSDLLYGTITAMEFVERHVPPTAYTFAFRPAFCKMMDVYRSEGLPGVEAYTQGVSRRIALTSLEVFKWKASMVHFNEVPSIFGNAFATKFGTLRMYLEGAV